MDVVYLFCESDSVRVPYFGYDTDFFRLIVSAGGGRWDKNRHEFVFGQANAEKLGGVFSGYPCVRVEKDSPVPLRVSGFWERPWDGPDPSFPEKQAGAASVRPDVGPPEAARSEINPRKNNPVKCIPPAGGAAAGRQCEPFPPRVNFSVFGPPSPPEKFPEHWRERLEAELRSRKYSPQTRRIYIYFNRLLCRTLQKTPEEINAEDVTRFLAVVEKDRDYSASSMNLAVSAVKFFYREVMKDDSIEERRRPRSDGRLPPVLSKEEVCLILGAEGNPKHRLLLMLVYSSGLRVSEVVALKREHVDLSRKVIYVRQGKGRKDRCTILSEKAAGFIAEYCAFYDIKTWLFPGQPPTRPLTIRSAQHIFDKALRRASILKKISIHGLRHTFATHLLESGTDIRYIQSLLGHASLRSTERYTHVARRSILNIKSPLDTIL